jgi:hypothetical protein
VSLPLTRTKNEQQYSVCVDFGQFKGMREFKRNALELKDQHTDKAEHWPGSCLDACNCPELQGSADDAQLNILSLCILVWDCCPWRTAWIVAQMLHHAAILMFSKFGVCCGQKLIQIATHFHPSASTVCPTCMFAEPQNCLPQCGHEHYHDS